MAIQRVEQIGCCTLCLGDYRDVLPRAPRIDLVLSDPPYGNDYRQKRSRDKLARPEVEHKPIVGNKIPFDPETLLGFPKVILWGANWYSDRLPAQSKWLIWDKRENTGPDDGADAEMAWTNLPGPTRMFHHLWRGLMRRGEENVSKGAQKLHPNQKPVALMNWCLDQAQVKPGDIVIDTHMGSGTTLVACLRRDIACYGVEIDPVHFQTAVDRLTQEANTNQTELNFSEAPKQPDELSPVLL